MTDPFGYLDWRAWKYLATLRDMDSAQALAHARTCAVCQYELAEIAACRGPSTEPAAQVLPVAA